MVGWLVDYGRFSFCIFECLMCLMFMFDNCKWRI